MYGRPVVWSWTSTVQCEVWSLTSFYYFKFLQPRIIENENMCFQYLLFSSNFCLRQRGINSIFISENQETLKKSLQDLQFCAILRQNLQYISLKKLQTLPPKHLDLPFKLKEFSLNPRMFFIKLMNPAIPLLMQTQQNQSLKPCNGV